MLSVYKNTKLNEQKKKESLMKSLLNSVIFQEATLPWYAHYILQFCHSLLFIQVSQMI
jgi:hypothetical protein